MVGGPAEPGAQVDLSDGPAVGGAERRAGALAHQGELGAALVRRRRAIGGWSCCFASAALGHAEALADVGGGARAVPRSGTSLRKNARTKATSGTGTAARNTTCIAWA